MRQVIIIGSGPAGYTAAIYAARANLAPLVIASSVEPGGELMNTTLVENFPGFPTGIMGPDLMENMKEQAEKFGAEIIYEDVTNIQFNGPTKTITLGDKTTHETKTIIYATGSSYRKLGLAAETRLSGYGVSWCATCDGAFFRNKEIAVVGGGDSAMEEALFLTRFADKVHIIHRGNKLRASKIMQQRAETNPKIDFIWNKQVTNITGEKRVDGIKLTDTINGTETEMPIQGLFIAIGNNPRTHLVHQKLELTPEGTISVKGRTSQTNIPGVFAAGDVVDPSYRQAITAASSGATAAIDAEEYLAHHG